MLSVTLDIFSARRNPSWILSPKEEGQLIDRVLANPSLIARVSAPTARGLGYRGYIVNTLKNEVGKLKIPSRFRIGHLKNDKDDASSWLLDTSEKLDALSAQWPAAHAHLRAAHVLTTDGHPDQASDHLHAALAFFEAVGATHYIRQAAEALRV